jgi:hypothetical protein
MKNTKKKPSVSPVTSPRVRWLLAAGVLVLLLGGSAAFFTFRSQSVDPVAKSAESATPAERAPRSRSARPLLPKPGVVREPHVAKWPASTADAAPADVEALVQRVTLPNGLKARMFAGQPSYPSSDWIDLHLELESTTGAPTEGRADLEVLVVDPHEDPKHQAFKAGFVQDPDHPGIYKSLLRVPPDWKRATALVTVSEQPNRDAPGQTELLQVHVDHAAKAALRGHPAGKWTDGKFELRVRVEASAEGFGEIRADVTDGLGHALGEVRGSQALSIGSNSIAFEAPLVAGDHTQHTLYLTNLALYVDGEWSDLEANPLMIDLPSGS